MVAYRSVILLYGGGAVCLVLFGGLLQQAGVEPGRTDPITPPAGDRAAPPRPMDAETARRLAHLTAIIARLDHARDGGDPHAALAVWREAYQEALVIPRWEAMAAVADAARSLAALGVPYQKPARAAYLRVLTRARSQRSLDGMLGAARGFAALGDGRVVEHALAVADRLAGSDPQQRDRVRVFIESLAPGPAGRTAPPEEGPAASPSEEP